MFMMVMSSTIISWARPTTPRISQRRSSRPPAPVLPAVSSVDMSPRSHQETPAPMAEANRSGDATSVPGYDPGHDHDQRRRRPGPGDARPGPGDGRAGADPAAAAAPGRRAEPSADSPGRRQGGHRGGR